MKIEKVKDFDTIKNKIDKIYKIEDRKNDNDSKYDKYYMVKKLK